MTEYKDLPKEELLELLQKKDHLISYLQEDSDWLGCLESAGVDNWCGYEHAKELAGVVDDE